VAVDDLGHVLHRYAHVLDRVEGAVLLLPRLRERLADLRLTPHGVDRDRVREGAADVDAHDEPASCLAVRCH
jgi:hypothetical protein